MYYSRYDRAQQLGGTLTKVRKFLHKFAPRELSPTRMLEKYATDTKKKGAAKLAAVATTSNAKNAAADAVLAQQLAKLNLTTPSAMLNDPLPDEIKADFPTPNKVAKPVMPNWTPWALGGALALGAVMLYRRRR